MDPQQMQIQAPHVQTIDMSQEQQQQPQAQHYQHPHPQQPVYTQQQHYQAPPQPTPPATPQQQVYHPQQPHVAQMQPQQAAPQVMHHDYHHQQQQVQVQHVPPEQQGQQRSVFHQQQHVQPQHVHQQHQPHQQQQFQYQQAPLQQIQPQPMQPQPHQPPPQRLILQHHNPPGQRMVRVPSQQHQQRQVVAPQQIQGQRVYRVVRPPGGHQTGGQMILMVKNKDGQPGTPQRVVLKQGTILRPHQPVQQGYPQQHQQHPQAVIRHQQPQPQQQMWQQQPQQHIQQQQQMQVQPQQPQQHQVLHHQVQQQQPNQQLMQQHQHQQVMQQGQAPAPQRNQEILYNVEHYFHEGGKLVTRMPIVVGKETMWAEVAQTDEPKDGLMLPLNLEEGEQAASTGVTAQKQFVANQIPNDYEASQQKPNLQSSRKASDFSEAEKSRAVQRVVGEESASPQFVGSELGVAAATIRKWVKEAGHQLPSKYKVKSVSEKSEASTAMPVVQQQPVNTPIHPPGFAPHPQQQIRMRPPMPNQPQTNLYRAPQAGPVIRQVVVSSGMQNRPALNGQLPPGAVPVVRPANKVPVQGLPPGASDPEVVGRPVSKVTVIGQNGQPVPSATSQTTPLKNEPYVPKHIKGFSVLCKNCGFVGADFNLCERCKKKIGDDCKKLPDKTKTITLDPNDPTKSDLRGVRMTPKARKRKAPDEPVCIAISSDEEDVDEIDAEAGDKGNDDGGQSNGQQSKDVDPDLVPEDIPDEEIMGHEHRGEHFTLQCRSIRVGSYKSMPKEKSVFTQKGIHLRVPDICDEGKVYSLNIRSADVISIKVNFSRSMPVIFLSLTPMACARARKVMGMKDKSIGFWLDLASADATQKYITILPEKFSEDAKKILRMTFQNVLKEIEPKEANELLVQTSPKDSVRAKALALTQKGHSDARGLLPSAAQQKMVVCKFPLDSTPSVNVTCEDYLYLEDESFLNDIIIEFYIAWLKHKIMSEKDRERTHFFNTFFYNTLTRRPQKNSNRVHPVEDNQNLSAAEKRYQRVKRWTKKVNIFEKDIVIVPINEHSHWYLAVICFPGVTGCRSMIDDSPLEPPTSNRLKFKGGRPKRKKPEKKVLQIGSTSIIPINSGDRIALDDSDRDEAEASDDDMLNEDMDLPNAVYKYDTNEEEDEKTDADADGKQDPEAKPEEEKMEVDDNCDQQTDEINKEKAVKTETDEITENNENQMDVDESSDQANYLKSEDKSQDDELKSEIKQEDKKEEDMEQTKVETGEDHQEEKDQKDAIESPKQSCSEQEAAKDNETTVKNEIEKEEEVDKDDENVESAKDATSKEEERSVKKERIPLKQPCILIFDSLHTGSRARVAATLRDYLACEYKAKYGTDREFTKENMKGNCPKVPQQPNFSDCGLYLLQYIQSFFENPIQDFTLPLTNLKEWFPKDRVKNKRAEIASLIRDLSKEQNPNKEIEFPNITFAPETGGSGYTDDEDEEDEDDADLDEPVDGDDDESSDQKAEEGDQSNQQNANESTDASAPKTDTPASTSKLIPFTTSTTNVGGKKVIKLSILKKGVNPPPTSNGVATTEVSAAESITTTSSTTTSVLTTATATNSTAVATSVPMPSSSGGVILIKQKGKISFLPHNGENAIAPAKLADLNATTSNEPLEEIKEDKANTDATEPEPSQVVNKVEPEPKKAKVETSSETNNQDSQAQGEEAPPANAVQVGSAN